MIKKFNIPDLELALNCYKYAYPAINSIDSSELYRIYNLVAKPPIYNIDLIIKALSDYIESDYYRIDTLYTESDLCKVIGVKKLTLHEWRVNGYINYVKLPTTRTIRYNLPLLLEDLKGIQNKNISVLGKLIKNKAKQYK